MLNEFTINYRINNFLGYGNLNSKLWFIGMEEGFDGSEKELEIRLSIQKNIFDLQNDMKNVSDHMKWFSPNSSLQKTWSKLILIRQILNSEDISNDKIKIFQRTNFGRIKSDHCILEFMPLPCKSTKEEDWIYSNLIPNVKSRKDYLKQIAPLRIGIFQELIKKYQPKLVIFYSSIYLKYWIKITAINFQKMGDIWYANNEETKFFVMNHPTSRGKNKEYWLNVANLIKTRAQNL